MIKKYTFLLFISSLFIAFITFAIHKNWILINFNKSYVILPQQEFEKKTIKLFFYKNEKWNSESVDIIWDKKQIINNLERIIKAWLNLQEEESIFGKRISLQYAIFKDKLLYISLDNSFFERDISTNQKLKILESLFKSVDAYFSDIKIYFLVHNNTMQDYHLDFSTPWQKEFFS